MEHRTISRRPRRPCFPALSLLPVLLSASFFTQAQVTFDVIGPREYEMPVGLDAPVNVFVQYAYYQDNQRIFDSNSDRQRAGSGSRAFVGQSKYVRFWSPENSPDVGQAFVAILPEISIRNSRLPNQADRHVSGLADPIVGYVLYKEFTDNLILGVQTYVQIPVGTNEVSDTNWKNLSSGFWNWKLGDFTWSGDLGFVWQSRRDDNIRPAMSLHGNHRFSYSLGARFEPFLALDHEHIKARNGNPGARVLDGGIGLSINTYDNQAIALRYSRSISGRNHSVADAIHLKYSYSW